jgi:hypothetical protein
VGRTGVLEDGRRGGQRAMIRQPELARANSSLWCGYNGWCCIQPHGTDELNFFVLKLKLKETQNVQLHKVRNQ